MPLTPRDVMAKRLAISLIGSERSIAFLENPPARRGTAVEQGSAAQ
jgi:hypothetical protein